MIDMKYLILVLLLLSANVFAQKVKIEVDNVVIDKDSIALSLNIKNSSAKSVRIYRPKTEDICYNILKVKLRNLETAEPHEIFPCTKILDLDVLNLTYENSIYLERGESYLEPFRFSLKDISPFLKKGNTYSLTIELNLKGIPFQAPVKNIYHENLVSNEVNWQYK